MSAEGTEATEGTASTEGIDLRLVVDDADHRVLARLWQLLRHDLATVVRGLPYADGRYSTRGLPTGEDADVAAYLALQPHPNTGEAAPVGFVVLDGLVAGPIHIAAAWVSPVVRGGGLGGRMVTAALARHPGPWTVAWQHDNTAAAWFWRRLADDLLGVAGWREERVPVPKPGAPDDHRIVPSADGPGSKGAVGAGL